LGVRAAISIVLLVHLLAVFCGPWAMPQYASPLAADCREGLRWYIDPLYLYNGYRFFAPEPGPSHLIRYELTLADGAKKKGKFPNREESWPRLLYHRHFMLSEFSNMLSNSAAPAQIKLTHELYLRSYARHLARKYNANQVVLTLVRHNIPGIEDVRTKNMQLSDPRLYQEQYLGTFSGDQL
jgi:hypothetical protein